MKAAVPGKFRSAITFGMVLWCGGAGCIIVSYAHGDAMSASISACASSSRTALGETPRSMGTHDCCKARHATEPHASSTTARTSSSQSLANLEELAEIPNSSDAMSCCPLTSGTFTVSGRQRISNDDASVSPGAEAISVITNLAATRGVMPLRLPDQHQTYLRGCVFLI
jgi:hypothetical protein